MSKYIETALPLTEINEVAIREKAGKPGHPANLHMWWGRSPEASSLAALAAAIMDFSSKFDAKLIAGWQIIHGFNISSSENASATLWHFRVFFL